MKYYHAHELPWVLPCVEWLDIREKWYSNLATRCTYDLVTDHWRCPSQKTSKTAIRERISECTYSRVFCAYSYTPAEVRHSRQYKDSRRGNEYPCRRWAASFPMNGKPLPWIRLNVSCILKLHGRYDVTRTTPRSCGITWSLCKGAAHKGSAKRWGWHARNIVEGAWLEYFLLPWGKRPVFCSKLLLCFYCG